MKNNVFSSDRRVQVLRRVALAACPPRDRPWVDAMFAEIDVVEPPGSQLAWVLGALQFVAASNLRRGARFFSRRLNLAIAFALCAAVVSAFFSRTEIEALGLDDDSFFVLAWTFAVVVLGLIAIGLAGSVRPPPMRKA